MRTFAEKPKAIHKNTPAKSIKPLRGHYGHSQEVKQILHLQRTIGNQAVQRLRESNTDELQTRSPTVAPMLLGRDFSRIPVQINAYSTIQPKLKVNTPGDKYEQEADRIADHVMRTPEPRLQRACADGKTHPNCQNQQHANENNRLQTVRDHASDTKQFAAPPIVQEALRSPGQTLDARTLLFMESRLGHKLRQIQVHTGPKASFAANQLSARAFTVGKHLVFGHGQFNPGTLPGQRLIAHELTHAIQQNYAVNPLSNTIQRDKDPAVKPNPVPTLKNIIPFKQGDRLTLNHLISEDIISLLKFAASLTKQLDEKEIDKVAALLPDLVKRTGTLKTITDDHAVIVIDKKAVKGKPTQAAETTSQKAAFDVKGSFTIELKRDPKQQTISLSVYKGQGEAKEPLGEKKDIKLSRTDGSVELSTSVEGTSVGIGITAGKGGKNITVALSKPVSAEILKITRLPKAREGSAEEKAAVTKAAASASESRAFKRFRLRGELGGNFPSSSTPSFMLGTSFQVNFRPIKSVGLFLQFPLEVQLQYAPPSSVLAAINSGAVLSLEQIVPINIRLIAGVGGGSTVSQPSGERSSVLGPTLGAGIDVKVLDSFSVGVRYQHLFNLIGDKVDANILSFGVSGRFGAKK